MHGTSSDQQYCRDDQNDGDSLLEAFRDELIDAVEDGPVAVEGILAKWCAREPKRGDDFRNAAKVALIFWGLREPERLGAYQLLEVLTVGGMGKIYRAKEDVTGRIVVVKTILAGHLSTAEQIQRFDTERRLLARLHDSHIVPLLATGEEGYLLYMVMPFIPGVTLHSVIAAAADRDASARFPAFERLFAEASKKESTKRKDATRHAGSPAPAEAADRNESERSSVPGHERLTIQYLDRVVTIMEHVAGAVQHIHQAKIIHRDLKPSNIMIESSGHSWVIDIGLGRGIDEKGIGSGEAASAQQHYGALMTLDIGTLNYMAPEQFSQTTETSESSCPVRQDARTDVWSLGVTLYEMLAFRPPFPGQDKAEIRRKILSEPPDRLNGSISRELKAICLKALEKEPGNRYASAAEFADDLRRWSELQPTRAGEMSLRRKLGNRLGSLYVWLRRLMFWSCRHPAATAALALVAVGVAGTIAYGQERVRAAVRELNLLALPQLRNPPRQADWYEASRQQIRSLRGGSTSPDTQLQSQAAASLEGIDARVVKSMPGVAQVVQFDPRSQRVMMVRTGKDDKGSPWSRTTIWDRTTDQTIVERELGDGVIAFRPDGTPLQLSYVIDDPSKPEPSMKLRLHNVSSGEMIREYRSPIEGLSDFGAIAIARDGSRLAAVNVPHRRELDKSVADHKATTIAVWDADSEKQILQLDVQTLEEVQGLTLSPDGRLLAAWDKSGQIVVWTLPDGKELSRFRVGRMPVDCLVFGRDPVWHSDQSIPSWLLAIGESSGLITVWDLRLERPRSVCRGSTYLVRAMHFSDDGALLLSAGRTPSKLWDVATGTCLLDLYVGDEFLAVDFASDGEHCAVSYAPNAQLAAVDIVELERGHGIHTYYGLQGVVAKTIFSADGRFVAAATHEWQIGIWERASGKLKGVLPAPVGLFADSTEIAFDADGRRLACSVGHQAQLWDLQAERLIRTWELHEGLCDSIAFVAPNRLLLIRCETQSGQAGPFSDTPASDDPRVVRTYDLLSPAPDKPIHEVTDFSMFVHAVALAPSGSMFVVEGLDKVGVRQSRIYDAATGKLLHNLRTTIAPDVGSHIHFDPSGKMLAIVLDRTTDGERWSLYNVPELSYRGATDMPVSCLGPAAEFSFGCTRDQPSVLILSDLSRHQPLLRVVQDIQTYGSSTFSPDGRYAAIGRNDGSVLIHDFVEINRRLSSLHLGW